MVDHMSKITPEMIVAIPFTLLFIMIVCIGFYAYHETYNTDDGQFCSPIHYEDTDRYEWGCQRLEYCIEIGYKEAYETIYLIKCVGDEK